jgi:hypothetical protein
MRQSEMVLHDYDDDDDNNNNNNNNKYELDTYRNYGNNFILVKNLTTGSLLESIKYQIIG